MSGKSDKKAARIFSTWLVLFGLALVLSFILSRSDNAIISLTTDAGIREIAPGKNITSPPKLVSPAAGTVQSSWQWRERVRAVVQQVAAANGYRVYQALYDKPDYPDPDARAMFLFKFPESKQPAPHGLLVLTPKDYVELALLDPTAVEAAIRQRLLGRWITDHGGDADARAAFAQHVLNLACILYAQPRMDQEFAVSISAPLDGAPLIVECGDLHLSLDSTVVNQYLELPALTRDRDIAEKIEKLDPKIIPYLRNSG